MISYDRLGFVIDGERSFLISGEFHYFRVPRSDWKRRMELFKASGGSFIATYVPWVLHEPREGVYDFADPQLDLAEYLRTAAEVGLKVILRIGPYVYSELMGGGIPIWFLEEHPEARGMDAAGRNIADSCSYLHPTYLAYVRKWYRAVCPVVRPFEEANDGPIALIQLDNELGGTHIWGGSLDYNPETLGLGQTDGRFARFLQKSYGDVEAMNRAYSTAYADFGEVRPIQQADKSEKGQCLRARDQMRFYRGMMSEYMMTLRGWAREEGLTSPLCLNSGNARMNCLFRETDAAFKAAGDPILVTSDHYYNLGQGWEENAPSPKYAIRTLLSNDFMRAMDCPPAAMELPGGSAAQVPPSLAPDMLACYMTNCAVGLKGLNYYIYTGGPYNSEYCGMSDDYDYDAIIASDGHIREDKYAAISAYHCFMNSHPWMQETERTCAVQIGMVWDSFRKDDFDWSGALYPSARADELINRNLLYSLMGSKFHPELVLLREDRLDLRRPLIVACPSALEREAQEAVVRFVERGGRVLLMPVIPTLDENYNECHVMDVLFEGCRFAEPSKKRGLYSKVGDLRIYDLGTPFAVAKALSEGARPLVYTAHDEIAGFVCPHGKGRVMYLGYHWSLNNFRQVRLLEGLLEELGAQPGSWTDSPNIFTTLWEKDAEHGTIFVMNLYSSPQSCTVYLRGRELGRYDLGAMEVRTIDY